ncbi:MAG TPA: hypothetical protein VIM58_10915 [Candidatus Methylacidiphilales bacterium]
MNEDGRSGPIRKLGTAALIGYAVLVAGGFVLMESDRHDPFRSFALILLTLPWSAFLSLLLASVSGFLVGHSWFDTTPGFSEGVLAVSGAINFAFLRRILHRWERKAQKTEAS